MNEAVEELTPVRRRENVTMPSTFKLVYLGLSVLLSLQPIFFTVERPAYDLYFVVWQYFFTLHILSFACYGCRLVRISNGFPFLQINSPA